MQWIRWIVLSLIWHNFVFRSDFSWKIRLAGNVGRSTIRHSPIWRMTFKKVPKVTRFKRTADLQITVDASRVGLRPAIQQREDIDEWKATHFSFSFLTGLASQISTNEWEFLGIVSSAENIRNYVYGMKLRVILDRKVLSSLLKWNHGKRTFSSRLTCCVDHF